MKIKLLILASLLLLFAVVFSSCNKPEPPKPDYPIKNSFEDYSLEGSSCQWINLPYNEKVIVINSNEELENFISCTEGSNPEIDFSKHTLLLASGKIGGGNITEVAAKYLEQLSLNEYILKIEISSYIDYSKLYSEWVSALIVEKFSKGSNIELTVSLKGIEPKIYYPVTVTDQNIIDFFDKFFPNNTIGNAKCFFITLGTYQDTCVIINNMSELREVYECTDNLPEIDFEKFSLIIGKKWVGDTGWKVSHQKIIENNALTFVLELEEGASGGLAVSVVRYWGLYPKLPNKPFIF